MKKILILAGVAALMGLLCAPAFADTDYYVEVGNDTTKDVVDAQWKALVEKHKSLLGRLQFYPKAVISSGERVATRIQAGPITSKAKAQKICAKLFVDDIPCFVIEGVGDAPPSEVMNLSEKADGRPASSHLPWAEQPEINAAPPVQEAVALPWLTDSKQEANRTGKVQVAEAIRVPLTDNFDPNGNGRVTVSALPDLKPTFRKPAEAAHEGKPEDTNAGWLTVDTFPNEDIATAFWSEVQSSLPKSAKKNLRVRVQRPLMQQQHTKASLAIGPFANSNDAYAFCKTIQAEDRGLNCNYGSSTTAATQLASNDTRRPAFARKRPTENPLSAIAPAAGPSKQYWVQVLSAPSQMEALHQWEAMKAGNTDLLKGMRSSVSTSAKDKNAYVVRVGPITSNDDAIQFCTKLQGRGIDCRVLLYSVGS